MKLKLVFDLDKTLVDNNIHLLAADILNMERKEPTKYDMSDIDDRVRHLTFRMFSEVDYMCWLPAYKGVQSMIVDLSKDHDLYILTARPKHLENGTKFMCQALFADAFKDIILTNSHYSTVVEDKIKILKKIGAYMYFDDHGDVAVAAQNAGIKAVLINNQHTLYNNATHCKSVYKEITSLADL